MQLHAIKKQSQAWQAIFLFYFFSPLFINLLFM